MIIELLFAGMVLILIGIGWQYLILIRKVESSIKKIDAVMQKLIEMQ